MTELIDTLEGVANSVERSATNIGEVYQQLADAELKSLLLNAWTEASNTVGRIRAVTQMARTKGLK